MMQTIKNVTHEIANKFSKQTTPKEQMKELAQQEGNNMEQQVEGNNIDPHLVPLFEELTHIKEKLDAMQAEPIVTPHDLLPIRQRLGEVDAHYHMGRFEVPDMEEGVIPKGQAALSNLLNQCHEQCRTLLETTDYYKVADELRPYHDKLSNIMFALNKVDKMENATPKDVRNLRKKLADIDAEYHMAKFEVGGNVPEGQAVIAGLLNDCHEKITSILSRSDYYRVAPQLMSCHDRLENVIMGFEGLMKKDSVTESEVAKYTHQLSKLDSMFQEGRFVVKGEWDFEGQSTCAELLHKAHALNQEVQDKIKA